MGILNELLENFGITGSNEPEFILHGQKISLNSVSNDLFTPPTNTQRYRDENEDIFFNSIFEQPPNQPPVNFAQITIKRASYLPLISKNEKRDSKRINELVNFFYHNPLINLNNFQQAQRLIFKYLDNPAEITEKLHRLQEELDKHSSDRDKFGKIIITWSLRTKGVRLTLQRPKFKGCKQLIALNYNPSKPELIVLTCWEGKHKKHELIRTRLQKHVHKRHENQSINFDAKVWHAFNFGGIYLKNYLKTLECLERNRNTLPELIQEINKKGLLNILEEPLLTNVSIKTDNQETTFLSFRSNASQKVDVRLCSFASSISMTYSD